MFTRKPPKKTFFVLVPTAKLRRNDHADIAATTNSAKEHNHIITFNYVISKLKIKVATGKIGLYY